MKFPITDLNEALRYIDSLEKESGERLELLIEVSNDVKKGNYGTAWKKAVAYLEDIDFELLLSGDYEQFN